MITTCTQFVIDLDASLKMKSNISEIWDRMLELDANIEPMITNADSWTLTSSPPTSLDSSELCVAQALRGMARIKLNRLVIWLLNEISLTTPQCEDKASSLLRFL